KWKLGERFLLRGSAGRGYRTPTLYELRSPSSYVSETWMPLQPDDPPCATQAGEECILEIRTQEMPDLQPEPSSSRTFGLVWSPRDGLDIALDHYRIVRRNEIRLINVQRARDYPHAWQLNDAGQLTGITLRYEN